MEQNPIIRYLQAYDGPEIKVMEVCGTHTAAIFKSGIRSLLSPKIKLIAGPGCPVCVTPTAYIDRCVEMAHREKHTLLSVGDMMKVPGSAGSLSEAKAAGARVELMYSPLEALEKAQRHPEWTIAVAATGFETTAPVYGLLVREAYKRGVNNIKLVTALKTILPAISRVCEQEAGIDGFLCPGHVSVVIGSDAYEALAAKYQKPFTVTGFEPEEILIGLYDVVRQLAGEAPKAVRNRYTSAVKAAGNPKALALMAELFQTGDAVWRGLGVIERSGLYLRETYAAFDGGSFGLDGDRALPAGCRCGDVIVGRIDPDACPQFGKACDPAHPQGPCMVSAEGACGIWYADAAKERAQ